MRAVKIHAAVSGDSRLQDSQPAGKSQSRKRKTGNPGHPGIQPKLKAGLESLSGFDLSGVRVHYNSSEPARFHAAAFTEGQDIHLGPGQERHLPHEAWHVVQQAQGRVHPTGSIGRTAVNAEAHLEREADRMGAKALGMRPEARMSEARDPVRSLSNRRSGAGEVAQLRDEATRAKSEDEALLTLGERLWREFPSGVNVIFFDDTVPELVSRSTDVAKREHAIASTKSKISASSLEFDEAFPDSRFKIRNAIPRLTDVLEKAAEKAGRPAGVEPLPGTGPARIRSLTVFAHGNPRWAGVGNDLNTRKAGKLIKKIAPSLTSDVNLVLYACSTGRGTKEEQNWRRGTMQSGGHGSLAATLRDALVEEKKSKASVWAHTTKGHTTTNWALRVFEASAGKGSAGVSFAGESVFGLVERIIAEMEIEQAIADTGHSIPAKKQARVEKAMHKKIKQAFYDCYREANKNRTFEGANLAEQAPSHPIGVASVIHDYWKNDFWPERRPEIANQLVEKYSLPTSETEALIAP